MAPTSVHSEGPLKLLIGTAPIRRQACDAAATRRAARQWPHGIPGL